MALKFNGGYGATICEQCRIIIGHGYNNLVPILVPGKKRELHYCSERCLVIHKRGKKAYGESVK
jgi:hypothetical protein